MRIKSYILKIALLLGSAIFLFSPISFGQKDFIELLEGSDELKMDGKTGNFYIVGNVIFKKDLSRLYCDSAYFNVNNNIVKAYGNVHLNKQDTLNMYCDSIIYDTKIEMAKLYGNVRVRNNEYKLVADSLDYDLKRDMGVYKNGGVISSISSNDVLSSKVGYFYPSLGRFNFRKDVKYTSDDYVITTDTLQFSSTTKKAFFYGPTNIQGDSLLMYCEKGWYDVYKDVGVLENNAFVDRPDIYISADSLYYSALDSLYLASKNVEIIDTTNKIAFAGDFAKNDERERYSFITGNTLAKRFDSVDTLYIHADTLYNYLDSIREPLLLKAFHGVKIFKTDFQGICDSLTYQRKQGEMNMYYNPLAWAKDAQLSGDTITIYEKNDEIERAFIRNKGLVVTHLDSTDYYNQVSGHIMTAYFDSTNIKLVEIEGSAKTIYFMEDQTETDSVIIVERKGMNRLYASDITLRFEKGEITTATYHDFPDGVLYPMNQIDKREERVETFQWNEEKRPSSWQSLLEKAEIIESEEVILPEEE